MRSEFNEAFQERHGVRLGERQKELHLSTTREDTQTVSQRPRLQMPPMDAWKDAQSSERREGEGGKGEGSELETRPPLAASVSTPQMSIEMDRPGVDRSFFYTCKQRHLRKSTHPP